MPNTLKQLTISSNSNVNFIVTRESRTNNSTKLDGNFHFLLLPNELTSLTILKPDVLNLVSINIVYKLKPDIIRNLIFLEQADESTKEQNKKKLEKLKINYNS